MANILIEQAIYVTRHAVEYDCLARSEGFLDAWLSEGQQLCAGFGKPPAGVECPACVFARPFGKRHVAVVQVAYREAGGAGQPAELWFHLLALPRAAYKSRMDDPFLVAERFPPPWASRGELPTLSWPSEAPPFRTVAEVQQVLKRPDGPTLLGGAQVLVDGGKLVFERPGPDTGLLRSLWTLLPHSTRRDLWPAAFAFGNELGFDVLVVPRASGAGFAGYYNEEQAENYPEGRYELNLQIAAEAGDQGQLNALFARRSRAQTWRLGLVLLAVVVAMALGSHLLMPPPAQHRSPASSRQAPLVNPPTTKKLR